MRTKIETRLLWVGVAAAALVVGTAYAVRVPIRFESGGRILAEDFNNNFAELTDAVQALEDQVATLQTELDTARSAAGFTTLPSGVTVPFFRKVFAGVTSSTTTLTLAHGVAGKPATERRFINCVVVSNYADNRQTVNLTESTGGSGVYWCDFSDTSLQVEWASDAEKAYTVVMDYVLEPVQ